MISWNRKAPLQTIQGKDNIEETWEYCDNREVLFSFPVSVRVGKNLDVLGLKGTNLKDILDYSEFLRKTSGFLYSPNSEKNELVQCPCCEGVEKNFKEVFKIFQVPYCQCGVCGHVFIKAQPTEKVLKEVFSDSEEHSAVYTESESLEIRLKQIIFPKLNWVLGVYNKIYAALPRSFLDVGAGGGHFVAGCQRRGFQAQGVELSVSSRRFAKENFNLQLLNKDFLSPEDLVEQVQVVTFWGLLEYVPDPKAFLRRAREYLSPESGLLIAEVPRFDCLGSIIQKECPQTVARHLDPTSHVNCFSDASLATALVKSGFRPVAAWYFGMDVYELFIQLGIKLDRNQMVSELSDFIAPIQACLDSGRLCDDIIIAAVPNLDRTLCLEESFE